MLENLIVPLVHPIAAGVNLILRSTLCPAANDSGRLNWDGVNSGLLVVMAEIVKLVCPLLVTVISRLSVWPTTISPNRRPMGAYASCGVAAPALTDTRTSSRTAKPMGGKWTVRTERD